MEDYFHIEAASGRVRPDEWDHWPSRVEQNVDRLLNLLVPHDHRATFFILGHVAQHHPQLVRRIAGAGHEIASHGVNHDRLHRLTADSFRQDLMAAKKLLEDQSGCAVVGYRAPTFSIVKQTAWAINVLVECGFAYDASIFPVRHPLYGVRRAPLQPFMVRKRDRRQSVVGGTTAGVAAVVDASGGGKRRLLSSSARCFHAARIEASESKGATGGALLSPLGI